MKHAFYTFHYTQYQAGEIKKQGEVYYFTASFPYNVDDMKRFVRSTILKEPDAVVTIQSVVEITQGRFEELTGKPFNI